MTSPPIFENKGNECNMIVSIISQGFVWAILGLGIFMTFRILNFPDMTTEGSFPLGGAVAVTLITQGVNPFLATLVAVGAGCLAGLATGLLYTKGKIPTSCGLLSKHGGLRSEPRSKPPNHPRTAFYSLNLALLSPRTPL